MQTVDIILISIILLTSHLAMADSHTPVEAFSSLPKYSQLKISPDGENYAAVVRTESGESVLAVIGAKDLKIKNRLEIVGDRGVGEIYWVNSGRIIASLILKLGSRDRPFATGEWIALSVNGDHKGYIFGRNKGAGNATIKSDTGAAFLTSLLPQEQNKVLMTVYNGSRAELIKLDVLSGRSSRVARLPGKNSRVLTDLDGDPRFALASRAEDGENFFDLFTKKSNYGWEKVASYSDENTGRIVPLAFISDEELYVVDNVQSDTETLVRWNLESGEKTPVYNHELVDIDTYQTTRDGRLYALRTMPDYPQTVIIDDDAVESRWQQDLDAAFKGSLVNITSSSEDNSKVVAFVEGDKFAPAYFLYEPKSRSVRKILDPYPSLANVSMGSVNAVSMIARDGVQISAYLTLPASGEREKLPLIVLPHGGPHGVRDRWGFDAEVQLLANRGYAVLQVNFRGSGGYGRDFLYSGYQQWGLSMQDDLTDATQWAVKAGIADKDRICIYGASYGGYAALMGGVKEPDLYKCVVGYVGVYDLEMMFEEGDVAQRESGINYLNDALGTNVASLRERSPINHLDKLKAPLMIVHGEKDVRAHFKHAIALREALDSIEYEYMWLTKPKEAHGFVDNKNRKELYTKLLAFFEEHIGD